MMICVIDWVEKAEKGKNAGFPMMFSKGFFPRVIKSRDCLVKTYTLTLSQTTNSRLFQTERVCKRQF